jgi:hypothetical protein
VGVPPLGADEHDGRMTEWSIGVME